MTSIRIIAPTDNFGFDIFRKQVAQSKGENVVIGPLSLSNALGMTANGAAGETFAGVTKALRLPDYGDQGQTNNIGFANLSTALTSGDLGVTMKIANSIWAANRADISFSKAFLKTNQDYFNAQIFRENFADPRTPTKMNTWVSDNTEKKINSVVKEIDPDTVMFVVNANYFKGEFGTKFDKSLTRPMLFQSASGQVMAQMMFRIGEYRYSAGENFEMVALPFGSAKKRFSLFVLLPYQGKTVEDIVNGLTGPSFHAACKDLYETELHLFLPKFEVEYEAEMNQALIDQGMAHAFNSSKADFSRMVDHAAGNIYISKVQHKVYLLVNEEGPKLPRSPVSRWGSNAPPWCMSSASIARSWP